MPYVGKEREAELIANPAVANTPGDYNALYTMAYLKAFIADPSYATIHRIRKAAFGNERFDAVEQTLSAANVCAADREAARESAFLEFYLRIGAPYENMARNKNGDLQLYKDAMGILHDKALEIAKKMLEGGTK